MEQNLTKEQIEEIKKKMADMPPEELKALIKQQCLFCQISEGKIPGKKIYEDDKVMAVLDINPASRGHTLVFLKEHYQVLAQAPDNLVGYLFKVVNKLSSKIFEVLHPGGTNIFVANGQLAGQNAPHAIVHIIPRYENDKIPLAWNPTKVEEAELNKLVQSLEIKSKLVEDSDQIPTVSEPPKLQESDEEEKPYTDENKRVPI